MRFSRQDFRSWAVVPILSLGVVACAGSGSELDGARTYYESLDLASPEFAVEVFTEAFAADDFMTVWLAFDAGAQFAFQQHFQIGDYSQLMDLDRLDEGWQRELIPRIPDWESTTDMWWMFDHLMLYADAHDAFLVDLSGRATLISTTQGQDTAEVVAEVEGVEGEVRFQVIRSPSGRWRVYQVLVPDGDVESVPWAVSR